ncbi:MAG TPA: hypothetical protein VMB52_04920 [Verrucomicrobiae bacterium]|nr:hypothetical protein [Verrucomicrobiae bacterium]
MTELSSSPKEPPTPKNPIQLGNMLQHEGALLIGGANIDPPNQYGKQRVIVTPDQIEAGRDEREQDLSRRRDKAIREFRSETVDGRRIQEHRGQLARLRFITGDYDERSMVVPGDEARVQLVRFDDYDSLRELHGWVVRNNLGPEEGAPDTGIDLPRLVGIVAKRGNRIELTEADRACVARAVTVTRAASDELDLTEGVLLDHPELRFGNKVKVKRTGQTKPEGDWEVQGVRGDGMVALDKSDVGRKHPTAEVLLEWNSSPAE